MESHTVPRKLLDQFAYDDPVTKSRRLWQYAKGREPWGRASPRTATRITGHLADPDDPEREARLEDRLNQEFEDPVHKFIDQLPYRIFVLSRSPMLARDAFPSVRLIARTPGELFRSPTS